MAHANQDKFIGGENKQTNKHVLHVTTLPAHTFKHRNNLCPCAGLLFAEFPSCPSNPDSSSEVPSGASESSGLEGQDSAAGQAPSGYSELGDGQVMQVLSKHLARFQGSSREKEEGEEEEGGESSPSPGRHPSPSSQRSCSAIVLYREAIEHCARLYRIMVRLQITCFGFRSYVFPQNLPGANALLLGVKGSGRKSLMRLMAYIKQSKVGIQV